MKFRFFLALVMSVLTISTLILENNSNAMDIESTSEMSDSKIVSCEYYDTFSTSSDTTVSFHGNPYKYQEYTQHESEQIEKEVESAFKQVPHKYYDISESPYGTPLYDYHRNPYKYQEYTQHESEQIEKRNQKEMISPPKQIDTFTSPYSSPFSNFHGNSGKHHECGKDKLELKEKKVSPLSPHGILNLNLNLNPGPNLNPKLPHCGDKPFVFPPHLSIPLLKCHECGKDELEQKEKKPSPPSQHRTSKAKCILKPEECKLKIKKELTSPNNSMMKSKSTFGRYGSRCKCLVCGWTGYPDHSRSFLKCEICSSYSRETEFGNTMILCPEGELPGLKLNKSDNPKHTHNGFICDIRLSKKNVFNVQSMNLAEKLMTLKKSNELVWFYCYECDDYFFIPINDIPHPTYISNCLKF